MDEDGMGGSLGGLSVRQVNAGGLLTRILAEALSYLHGTEQVVHMNVCPHSVIVTKRGMWKLTGFAFAEYPSTACDDMTSTSICRPISDQSCCYPTRPWTPKQSKMAQPDLDYVAPDVQLHSAANTTETGVHASPACDVYSFGQLVCAVFNDGRPLIQAGHNVTAYTRQFEQMSVLFNEVNQKLPSGLTETVEKMIGKDSKTRPSLQQFMALKYFDDPVVRCMLMLDSVDTNDLLQKFDFFNKLPRAIPQCPLKLLYNCVLPMMKDQLEYADMLEFLLPSFIAIAQHASQDDFTKLIQSDFKKIFPMQRPVQATVYLLENLNIILTKFGEEDIKTDVLPMMFSALESNSIAVQEAAINVFSNIRQYLDDQAMRTIVLPKAKTLFGKTTQTRTRLKALECIGRLLKNLDKMIIVEEVLPFLADIQCTEAEILMAIIAIYTDLTADDQCIICHSLLATKVMPSLLPHAVSPSLNISQFTELMTMLHRMLSQIEKERLSKMQDEIPDEATMELRRRKSMDMRFASSSLAPSTTQQIHHHHQQQQQQQQQQLSSSLLPHPTLTPPPTNDGALMPKVVTATSTSLSVNASAVNGSGGCGTVVGHQPSSNSLQLKSNGLPELKGFNLPDPLILPHSRRRSSYQGLLRVDERASLKRSAGERRASLFQPLPPLPPGNPHILVSEASVSNFVEMFNSSPIPLRRASTQSVGAVIVAEPGRRDSRGRLVDRVEDANRRCSFQGICEHAMEFFMGTEKT